MTLLTLPDDLRGAFKEPMGPVYTDTEQLLSATGDPIVAVGDVVTYHLRVAGRDPDVAVIDGKTKREAVGEEIAAVLDGENRRIEVENAPATLSRDLLSALVEALASDDPVVIHVAGEEDLATVPAIVAAPEGASVVYGQPDEGMVLVDVTPDSKREARDLLGKLDGDAAAALAALGLDS
ncbi:GTP-dependent dephospho-CoA kinase family protein [Halobaculum magnesiiphilum]|uniref:GTP-dependent dephospho-CoA kinase n=1 Tax=Halobaculum magnesiiphilum TaxID=1017351 RepID=A0A8T8W9L4_9EURY|nr:GTP-dependent dephospho-CoA kinase family protein [Halobaculum magnesiiphilum]QZP36518.1 GTP-dependent dephospho-CoA kinase family protein [Halobaculum magnesiiphilum]